jgi:hypothetical protein
MSRIFVCGTGAVSPAGWGVAALHAAVTDEEIIPLQNLARPGLEKPLQVRNAPPPKIRPDFFLHPRLRRASTITQHVVAAALEALGEDAAQVQAGASRLGIIVCTMAGGIAYSRRFYEEVLREPATASPAVFPETVFNAPASHLAAYLGTSEISCTLVGDDGTFLQGLAVAAEWLLDGRVDGVVVVGAEELDWVVAEAMKLFYRDAIHSAGAGAIYLRKEKKTDGCVELAAITDSFLFTQNQNRAAAAQKMRAQLPEENPNEVLCLSAQKNSMAALVENHAWRDWSGSRLGPKAILGEALAASVAWQCVAACEAIRNKKFSAANISVVGVNQQAIGARFLACTKPV